MESCWSRTPVEGQPCSQGVIFEDTAALRDGIVGGGDADGGGAADFPGLPKATAAPDEDRKDASSPAGGNSGNGSGCGNNNEDKHGQGGGGNGSGHAGGMLNAGDRHAALDSLLNPQTAHWESHPEVCTSSHSTSHMRAWACKADVCRQPAGASSAACGMQKRRLGRHSGIRSVYAPLFCTRPCTHLICPTRRSYVMQRAPSGTSTGAADGGGGQYLVMPQPVLVPRLTRADSPRCIGKAVPPTQSAI